eukprot:gene12168-14242_t
MSTLLDNYTITKKNLKLYARKAETRDVEQLTKVINYAYRGKEGCKPWTCEDHLVKGLRIDEIGLTKEIASDPMVKCIFLVELCEQQVQDGQEVRTIVGSIKIERESADSKAAMIGMFSVDPALQSNGIGGVLFRLGEDYAKNVWHATEGVLHVLSVRDELLAWYYSMQYKATGKLHPFHNADHLDKALIDNLCFSELRKQLL